MNILSEPMVREIEQLIDARLASLTPHVEPMVDAKGK